MKVLVTGAAGFTGRRMMEYLSAPGAPEPVGLVKRLPLGQEGDGSFIAADLLDQDSLKAAVSATCPDAVIHLAGLTQGTAEALAAANVTGTKNLLNAAVAANPSCRILVVSSSAVYGYAGDSPIPETAPLRPVGDYGKSKVAQEDLCRQFDMGDSAVAVVRPFNLAGPGQPDSFVCGRIVRQVNEIHDGKRDTLELREIVSSRDLVDVRDVVRGYWALVSRPDYRRDCSGKAFNLGSGMAYRVSAVIALVEEITGERYEVRLPEKPPAIPVPTQRSDNSRITSLTGWRPEIPLKETLRDMLDAARA